MTYRQGMTQFKAWRAQKVDITKLSIEELNTTYTKLLAWKSASSGLDRVRFHCETVWKEITKRKYPCAPKNEKS